MNYSQELSEAVKADLRAAAEAIAKKHGLDIAKVRNSYGEKLELTINFVQRTESGGSIEQEKLWQSMESYLRARGVDPQLLGKTVLVGRTKYVVLGLRNTRSTKPVCLKGLDGKTYNAAFEFLSNVKAAQ